MKRKSMQGHVAIDNFALPRSQSETLAPLRPKPENAVFEVILLPLLVPFLAWLMGREDLFFLETPFPWMLLVPTLTASRYGTRYGLLSLTVMSSLSLLYAIVFQPSILMPLSQILVGSLLVVLVIGEMIQYWGNRTQQQAKELEGYRLSASQSEQALQLLHISYSQLEEDLVAVNQSLAGSLRLLDTSIRQHGSTDRSQVLKHAIDKMQDILKQYPWLEAAAFYRISDGQIHQNRLGSIGNVPANTHMDPLLLEAVRCKQAVSIKHDQLIQKRRVNTNLHAAIPLIDSNGKLWGVMAVSRMANAAMTQQNLNLLALLCNYVSNLLDNSKRPVTNAKQLFQEMFTALNVVLNTVKTATLITLNVPNTDDSSDYNDYFVAKVRSANRIWRLERKTTTTFVILLPLFNTESFKEFHTGLSTNFKKRFGKDLSQVGITLKYNNVRKPVKPQELQRYLANLGKFEDARLIR
ncbi:hypothetical protein EOL70_12055 [Leucothrix sargassi]|nr:hypothetical protein EOL70_12055 [Leucothrix sargassi]